MSRAGITTPADRLGAVRVMMDAGECPLEASGRMLPIRDGDRLIVGMEEGDGLWVVFRDDQVHLAAFWLADNHPPELNRRVALVTIREVTALDLKRAAS